MSILCWPIWKKTKHVQLLKRDLVLSFNIHLFIYSINYILSTNNFSIYFRQRTLTLFCRFRDGFDCLYFILQSLFILCICVTVLLEKWQQLITWMVFLEVSIYINIKSYRLTDVAFRPMLLHTEKHMHVSTIKCQFWPLRSSEQILPSCDGVSHKRREGFLNVCQQRWCKKFCSRTFKWLLMFVEAVDDPDEMVCLLIK